MKLEPIPFDPNAPTEQLNRERDALNKSFVDLKKDFKSKEFQLMEAIAKRDYEVTQRWQKKGESPAPERVISNEDC